jgi:TPR repeat protein
VKIGTVVFSVAVIGAVTAAWTWPPSARFLTGRLDNNIGYVYLHGIGVGKDAARAVTWFTKAADLGDAPAAANLGFLYQTGQGVPVDARAAAAWYERAARGGLPEAANNLATLYSDGSLGQPDLALARGWLKRAKATASGELKDTVAANLDTVEGAMDPEERARSDRLMEERDRSWSSSNSDATPAP